jgi:hypothetical protein
LIQPFGYLTVYSANTNLTLSNTNGAVRLLDGSGLVSGLAVSYDDVEEGNSYAINSDGQWAWTTTPTPLLENVFTVKQEKVATQTPAKTPASSVKSTKTTTKTSTPKTTAVKSATAKTPITTKSTATKKASSSQTSGVSQGVTEEPTKDANHPWILAGFGLLAVLYGLYEYRDDVANSVQRFRRNASTRKRNRQSVSG